MNRQATVLVVDDEDYVRDSLATLLERRGFVVRTAASVDEAERPERVGGVDAVVTDLRMPGRDGLDLVRSLASDEAPPILVLTAYGSIDSAVECLRAGASDYLLKPTNIDELVLRLDRCLERGRRDRERLYLRDAASETVAGDPIGVSAAWRRVVELAETAAQSDAPVLVLGETGTGKEEVARLIHRRSARSGGAFVAVNCAAVPLDLFESEFFGHRRGAFTGAVSDRDGRFRVADGGSLFLDEINSLPAAAQAKVLRVLEDGSFERVGDSQSMSSDARVICASNARLEEEVDAGRFRSDLLYRINTVTIEIPPLRSRPEDVEPLAEAFLAAARAELGRRVERLDPRTLDLLRGHSWPGNVRELRNVVDRAVLLEKSDRLTPESLPPLGSRRPRRLDSEDLRLAEVKRRAEREALEEALRRAGGVRKEAARMLGVDEKNLAYYLRKHDLMERGRS